MRKTINSLAKALPIAGLMALSVDAYAQPAGVGCLTNGAGGTITNLSTGTITLVEDESYINNDNTDANSIVNDGVIQFSNAIHTLGGAAPLGTAAIPVPGNAVWNGTMTQDILEVYYTDLFLEGAGAKEFAAGTETFIADTFSIAAGTGARTYGAGSAIVYNNDDAGITQYIAGEGNYAQVRFEGQGPKQLNDGVTATVNETTTIAASNTGTLTIEGTYNANETMTKASGSGTLALDGSGALNLGDAAAEHTFNGDVTLGGTSTLASNAATNGAEFIGTVTVTSGTIDMNSGTTNFSGTIALADDVNAAVDVADGATFEIEGTFNNARDERDNMTFAANSTTLYSGSNDPQNVISTAQGNPYGNLTLTGGNKSNSVGDGTESNVNIAGNFSLAGGDFTVDGDNTNDATDSRSLVMLNSTSTVTYADLEEVVGGFRWSVENGPLGNSTYTLNNASASFSFPSDGPAQAAGGWIELRSYPGVNPRNVDTDIDVNRLYQLWYNITDWSDLSLQLSYEDGERPANWATENYDESMVRLWESDNDDIEKISTGSAYTRGGVGNDATIFNTVALGGIDPSTDGTLNVDGIPDDDFFSSNDFVLRGGPTTFYTIAHGRWSNPATWDEAAEPGSNDRAVILHTVHAGYTRATDNYATAEATPSDLAIEITIDPNASNGGASLLIGGGVNFGVTGNEGTLEILSVPTRAINAPLDATLTSANNDSASNSLYNGGLYVFLNSGVNVTGCLTVNNGDVKNAGTIPLGNN